MGKQLTCTQPESNNSNNEVCSLFSATLLLNPGRWLHIRCIIIFGIITLILSIKLVHSIDYVFVVQTTSIIVISCNSKTNLLATLPNWIHNNYIVNKTIHSHIIPIKCTVVALCNCSTLTSLGIGTMAYRAYSHGAQSYFRRETLCIADDRYTRKHPHVFVCKRLRSDTYCSGRRHSLYKNKTAFVGPTCIPH